MKEIIHVENTLSRDANKETRGNNLAILNSAGWSRKRDLFDSTSIRVVVKQMNANATFPTRVLKIIVDYNSESSSLQCIWSCPNRIWSDSRWFGSPYCVHVARSENADLEVVEQNLIPR